MFITQVSLVITCLSHLLGSEAFPSRLKARMLFQHLKTTAHDGLIQSVESAGIPVLLINDPKAPQSSCLSCCADSGVLVLLLNRVHLRTEGEMGYMLLEHLRTAFAPGEELWDAALYFDLERPPLGQAGMLASVVENYLLREGMDREDLLLHLQEVLDTFPAKLRHAADLQTIHREHLQCILEPLSPPS